MAEPLCLSADFDMDHNWEIDGNILQDSQTVSANPTETETTDGCQTRLVAEVLADEANVQWSVRLRLLVDNQAKWIPFHRKSFIWAFFILNKGGLE
jgi:hypothetical protein